MPAKEMAQILETEAAKLEDFNEAVARAANRSANKQRKTWKRLSAFAAEMSELDDAARNERLLDLLGYGSRQAAAA
jgi:hypothetical protein